MLSHPLSLMPHSSYSLLSQLSTLSYSLAHHCKESLTLSFVALRGHRFFFRGALCPLAPSPISFLQKVELPSTLASSTAARSGPEPLRVTLKSFSLRPFGVL
ncbi:hypothetical protein HN51_020157 [Arachis hypogaea]